MVTLKQVLIDAEARARVICAEEGVTDPAEIARRVHALSERAAAMFVPKLPEPPDPL